MNEEQLKRLENLERDLSALNDEVYLNNFTSSKDENKYVRFNTRVKVPHLTALPSTCETGEIAEYSGKLYICSATNTWTIAGTQS